MTKYSTVWEQVNEGSLASDCLGDTTREVLDQPILAKVVVVQTDVPTIQNVVPFKIVIFGPVV